MIKTSYFQESFNQNQFFFDTHAHYNNIRFNNLQNIILNNLSLNNIYVVNVGCDIKSSYESIMLAKKYTNIYAAVGIHPLYINNIDNNYHDILKKMIDNNEKIIAIGEIGLDNTLLDNYEKQKKIFIKQLHIAYEYQLPVILHIRNLYKECLEIINYYKITKGIIHCYSCNDPVILKKFIDMNFFISLSGNITFHNNYDFNNIIKIIPNDKILLETDSPYLSPIPFRNKINTSFHIKYIAKKIADIKKENLNFIYNITKSNTLSVFNLKNK